MIEAINRFDLSSAFGLRAFADPWIRKFISEQTKGGAWHKFRNDIEDKDKRTRETRADRVLHSHPSLIDNPNIRNPAELLANMAGCTPQKAEEAIAVYRAGKHQEHYSTTGSADDGDGTKGWDYESDKPDRDQNPVPIDLPDRLGVISQFSRNGTRAPWNGRWWAIHSTKRKRVYGPLQDGRVTEVAEWSRLLRLGRRAYALELVKRDNRKIKDTDTRTWRTVPAGAPFEPTPQPHLAKTRQTKMDDHPCLTKETKPLARQLQSRRLSSASVRPSPKPAAMTSQSA